MTVNIIRGTEINAPAIEPIKSSILDHATVVETASFGHRNNEGLWLSYNALDTQVPLPDYCEPEVDPDDPDYDPDAEPFQKTFASASWISGAEFSVHGGVTCKAIGLDRPLQESEVKRVFAATEGRGVERGLLASVLRPDAEDVTPTTAASLSVALAALEGRAAATYAGLPTIHMSRAAATLLGADKIVWVGDKAYTRLGSKVAIGGGYDTDEDLTGTFDLYATGEVFIEKSDMVDISTFDTLTNDVLTLVERMYRVGIDSIIYKASGKAW